ncbi:hypothetical protein SDRG_11775 [Saprolegnia diclina VS20]|uniref:Uncharacterized protein n=1 Tax=Saprolegnia diclina (strain VS20) TaxID=1156394 RepID=T0QAF0_SAPDV|nr:hypothetical protein SDRG_11775 [Saprolegnia diclina VS20]EQC30455.1 hypothetical protein SDRG_11775 [Saprolegnia diclina VS20]|eukprot:XP_008616048.1 hypothetical protein SDRG_11775 [Saprolegnia diclina VS20]
MPTSDEKALLNAARDGNLAQVQLYLNKCVKVNCTDDNGYAPLHWAVSSGHVDVVRFLLEKGAKLDAENKLLDALREKRIPVATRILQNSFIHANLRDSSETPLLHLVVSTQDLSLLQKMLSKPDLEIDVKDATGRTALAVAIIADNAESAQALYQACASVDFVDESILASALLHAASGNNDRMVAQLLRFGVNPTSPNEHGETALHMAAARGHMPILTTLFQAATVHDGIDATNHSGESPLFAAAGAGHADIVKALTAANASPKSITSAGSTLLHAAAIGGSPTVLDHVLPLCNDAMEMVDELGQTPLHVAAAKGHGCAVKYLLDAGANVLAASKTGATPLMLATHPYAIAVLQRAGS